MAKLKKAQGGIGRLFNKAGMKMVEATTKKGLKKTTSAAMSPGQRDLAEAIWQIERAELKKKMQAIDRRMEGEKVLNSIGKKQRSGGSVSARKIKKAQTGTRASADNTRVKKSVTPLKTVEPTYKGLKWVDTPTKEDSASYRKGFFKGIQAKRKGEKNTSGAFGTSPEIRGFNEGYKKQRSGGKIKPKASNVSKKLGSAKKSIGNMRFTKKKK